MYSNSNNLWRSHNKVTIGMKSFAPGGDILQLGQEAGGLGLITVGGGPQGGRRGRALDVHSGGKGMLNNFQDTGITEKKYKNNYH